MGPYFFSGGVKRHMKHTEREEHDLQRRSHNVAAVTEIKFGVLKGFSRSEGLHLAPVSHVSSLKNPHR